MGSEVDSDCGSTAGNPDIMEKGGGMDSPYHLDKFTLFETPSNFYMIGRDENKKRWRVLKIGRRESSELTMYEDPTVYTSRQCKILLQDINEGNKQTGGNKFVTNCYGIVGVIRFLGPYYIILITKRRVIGKICGHTIYAISEYKIIPIPHSSVLSGMDNSEREKRYKKLIWLVDIRKNFFFSYSYPVMHSLQRNLGQQDTGHSSHGTMFVWNDYLTHHIRNHLKNTLWTVALVHGFFKQVELSNGGTSFLLTLIARRSSQFAGTRYQKRGVNKEGEAANDVEIEQIVSHADHGKIHGKITSVVQNRGSIPLLWSQKPSVWVFKPEILLSEDNNGYEATQLHFQKLRLRYGDPIILLNLVKACEKKLRESPLRDEFHKAVDCINSHLEEEYHVELLSLDLDAAFRKKDSDVLTELKDLAARALNQIELFSCQISQPIDFQAFHDLSYSRINENYSDSEIDTKYQKGIFRSNCIDSLDRTNYAQFVYTLVALGHQLHALELTSSSEQDLDDKLVRKLMSLYEALGDALSLQYGGSAAHSKIFNKSRGQSKAANLLQGLVKSAQRHISNSFLDLDKQQAIDLFLGKFRPPFNQSTPQRIFDWNSKRRRAVLYSKRMSRSTLKRSLSDSDIPYIGSSAVGDTSEISSSGSDFSDLRHTSFVSTGWLLSEYEKHWYGGMKNDAQEVASLGRSHAGSSVDLTNDESDGWQIVHSSASSSCG